MTPYHPRPSHHLRFERAEAQHPSARARREGRAGVTCFDKVADPKEGSVILAAEVGLPASCLNTGELRLEMLWLLMTAELVGWCRRGAP